MSQKSDYNLDEFEDDYTPQPEPDKSIKGYRIVIGILSIILVAITILYYSIHSQQQEDYEILQGDRDMIQGDLEQLVVSYDSVMVSSDLLSEDLNLERQRADSLMDRLSKERSWNLSKLRDYQTQVKLLRSAAESYLHQIDSLSRLNKKLADENVSYRKEISSAKLRAEMAEEKAEELDNKVKAGSVLRARSISLVALNGRDREISRIKSAERLRVDFVLAANELTQPGEKRVYLRLTSPDGYLLTTESLPTFDYEGEAMSYSAMRDVDYQNQDLDISIYYNSEGFTAGVYTIQLYCEGRLIGETQIDRK